jgi:hypothetical protein
MLIGGGRHGVVDKTARGPSKVMWSTPLRVFILYANQVVGSFGAVLHVEVITACRLVSS